MNYLLNYLLHKQVEILIWFYCGWYMAWGNSEAWKMWTDILFSSSNICYPVCAFWNLFLLFLNDTIIIVLKGGGQLYVEKPWDFDSGSKNF